MKLKLCITFLLVTIGVTCLSLAIVLVPILVIPALSDSKNNYDPVPSTCKLNDIEIITEWKKCRIWQSCRQNCSSQDKQCSRVYVNYRRSVVEKEENESANNKAIENIKEKNQQKTTDWTETAVPLLVNSNSCGELPGVDCEFFFKRVKLREEFSCYSSHANSRLVVMQYTWQESMYPLVLAIGLPIILLVIFATICIILCFWYCRKSSSVLKDTIAISRKYAFE